MEAFEAFVAASGNRLLQSAFLLTGDRGHAEDLVQATLEKVARHWSRLDERPEGYARVVLANLATDRWRRLRARVTETLTDRHPDPVEPDITGRLERREELVRALQLLAPQQRNVLVLRYFEDMTEADTARTLGISVGTVKSTASRSLVRLRELLSDAGDPAVERETT